MKNCPNFCSALSIAATALSLTAVGGQTHFKPDISYKDGGETIATNPGRGHAGGGWTTFKPEGLPNWHGQGGYHSSLWELSRFSGGREQGGKRPSPERVGEKDMPLTDAMKADVRRFLSETRAKGGTLIVRLGYTWSDQQGCEPSDFDIVLGHVKDLSQIMRDFDDVIVGIEAGVAGPWGEMHSSDYCGAEYMNRILKTYIDNLGPRIPVLVRAPSYFNKLAGVTTPELLEKLPFTDPYLKRLGMYNDGYLGTWWDYGTWAGDFTRERGCTLLKTIDRAPYGGEMAYVDRPWLEKNMKLFEIEHWNIVRDWYDCHLNYLRNIAEGGHTLANFIREELVFKVDTYRYEGMPDLTEYDGVKMGKFVLDHMGYRFVVRDARLPERLRAGEMARIALDIENTGFGRVLLPMRAEVVLANDGKVREIVSVQAFDLDLAAGERRRVAVDVKPMVGRKGGDIGKADVYLRVSCPTADETDPAALPRRPIRFGNSGMWNDELKANRLGTVGRPL